MTKLCSRILATSLSAAMIWLSPGLGAIEAFAQMRGASVSGAAASATVGSAGASISTRLSPGATLGSAGLTQGPAAMPQGAATLSMPATVVPAGSALSLPVGHADATVSPAWSRGVAARARVAPVIVNSAEAAQAIRRSLANARAGEAQGRAPVATRVGRISIGVQEALQAGGKVQDMEPTRAAGLGARLQSLLSGERAALPDTDLSAPADGSMGSLNHGFGARGPILGRPAGWDSIHRAVQAGGTAMAAPAPVAPTAEKRGDGFGGGNHPPFFARVVASVMALGPAAYFGLPLAAAGAWLPVALLGAAGLGLAVLPWLGAQTPRSVLVAPGLLVALLGGVTIATASGWGIAVGALVALTGWGFARFARGNRKYPGALEQMSAIFGALSATAAAGLVLTGAAGFVAAGATILASLFAARLLAELPEWTYAGVWQSLKGAYKGAEGTYQVLSAIRHDTVLYDRLVRFTERQVKQFGWFSLIWTGALWIPALISEAIQFALAISLGVALGVVQAPILFGWGAFAEVHDKGALRANLAVRFANWEKETFSLLQGSKTTVFNHVEQRLLGLANSKSRLVSLMGAALIRSAQFAWVGYALLGGVLVPVVTFVRAFTAPFEAYDSAKHGTSALRLPRDPLPDQKPDERDDPIGDKKEPFFPRLIAAAVAVAPVYFFGLPFFAAAAPLAGWLYAAGALAVATLPLMPQSTPRILRLLPGAALALAGLGAAFLGGVPLVGVLAGLAGWGLSNFASKLKTEKEHHRVTDPEYVGAFFGALGAVVALGAALSGMGGMLGLGLKAGGLLASALVAYHLPSWFWRGGRAAAEGFGYSPRRIHEVMNFWDHDTRFYKNMRRWWNHWGNKSPWHWWWMWPTAGAYLLMEAYDFVASAVPGLALAALRIPLHFAWGAAYRISPTASLTRFIGGFAKSSLDNAEGAKPVFDRWVKPLVPGMEKQAESGRPTVGAVLSLGLSRLVQLGWLARIALWSPVILARAILDGIAAVKAGAPADGTADPLNPNYL